MPDFEKLYYEEERFWEGDMLQDKENQQRIEFTAAMIPGEVKGVCDIGCGNGVFVNYLQQNKKELDIIAIDRSAAALKFVHTNKQEGDIADIPLKDNSYDCVTCLEVIEHLPWGVYEKALSELTRVSKEYVIISVPYLENLEERHNQCPSCKTIFNHDLHLRMFDDNKMQHLLESNGFKCIRIDHLGASTYYKGHETFRRIFYKEQFKDWRSPICPLCGFASKKEETAAHKPLQAEKTSSLKSKIIPLLSAIPKLLWPKEKKYYWVIALYKKESGN